MPTVTISDIGDIAETTLSELHRGKWSDLTTDVQEHVAASVLFRKERVMIQGGDDINYELMTDHNNSARNVGLFAQDQVSQNDTLKQATVPWRHTTWNYLIERRQALVNKGAKKIRDFVRAKRVGAAVSGMEKLEDNFWGKPADSTDEVTPYGIDMWIVTNATTGFNGGNPSGFSAGVGSIDASTYTRWKNYTHQYTNVSRDDFMDALGTAIRKTNFKTPVPMPTNDGPLRRAFYTNDTVLKALERLAEDQNQNIGDDLQAKMGDVVIKRSPVIYAPKLDDNSNDPFYGVDWGSFRVYFLEGDWMTETVVSPSPRSHNCVEVHTDITYNVVCVNRRKQMVFATSTF